MMMSGYSYDQKVKFFSLSKTWRSTHTHDRHNNKTIARFPTGCNWILSQLQLSNEISEYSTYILFYLAAVRSVMTILVVYNSLKEMKDNFLEKQILSENDLSLSTALITTWTALSSEPIYICNFSIFVLIFLLHN